MSVDQIKRARLETIALTTADLSTGKEKNFGYVFTMHYKKYFILVLSLACMTVNASPLGEHLRKEMLVTYDNLNIKVGECRKIRKQQESVSKGDIHSAWFNSLTKERRAVALSILSQIALEKCYSTEEALYTKAMLAYVAESGDSSRLDDWLNLKKIYRPKDLEDAYQKIDMNQIELLLKAAPFNQPFNPLQISDLHR